ncbi:MAG TPA: polymer-forming cytoskeletal protein [Thermodesulfobacteriota bacterium]|jgi:cytoskeletal protein CcmA (bactofilin family)|nr:polymer-forming cytoskeletal protein [Thermodesulfobacteriota bacterium]
MAGAKSLFSKSSPTPPPAPEEISAYLGKETFFEGKMTFEGVFRLDGRFEGEIFDSGTLIVGETASVKGKIGLNTIVVNGVVEGEVYARTRVEIHSMGKVYGTLSTPTLVINEGGIFEGHCKMEGVFDNKEDKLDLLPQKADHSLIA